MSSPEKIWVIPDDNQDGCCPVETDLDDVGKYFDARRAISYTRTDLSQASVAAALEAAANAAWLAGPSQDLAQEELSDIGKERRDMAMRCEAAIRALITPAQHDALAAHVAAEVAKARAEDAATREVSADLLRRCRDELYLIRSKDCGAVYDITLRMELADAIAQIGAKP